MTVRYLLLISFFINVYSMNAQPDALIGMSISDFEKNYPDCKKQSYKDEITYSFKTNLFGLNDSWGFRFKDEKLNWIFFHHYIDEINQENFNKCLSATQKIIKQFTKTYGKPTKIINGDLSFKDPYTQRHWGYDVIEAQWQNYKDMKFKVKFNFMGGKGEYNFLVSIEYYRQSYPFF